MLKHPTLDLLGQLGLAGMAKAFAEMESNDDAACLSHAEWLALLLDHEATYRNDRRLALQAHGDDRPGSSAGHSRSP